MRPAGAYCVAKRVAPPSRACLHPAAARAYIQPEVGFRQQLRASRSRRRHHRRPGPCCRPQMGGGLIATTRVRVPFRCSLAYLRTLLPPWPISDISLLGWGSRRAQGRVGGSTPHGALGNSSQLEQPPAGPAAAPSLSHAHALPECPPQPSTRMSTPSCCDGAKHGAARDQGGRARGGRPPGTLRPAVLPCLSPNAPPPGRACWQKAQTSFPACLLEGSSRTAMRSGCTLQHRGTRRRRSARRAARSSHCLQLSLPAPIRSRPLACGSGRTFCSAPIAAAGSAPAARRTRPPQGGLCGCAAAWTQLLRRRLLHHRRLGPGC